jgi:endonuclease YncB( thermonuclease family)
MSEIEKYKNCTPFTFKGKTLKGYVLDCYDGDTITCSIFIMDNYYSFKVRLYGIDTPEIKQSSSLPDEQRKKNKTDAIKSKNFVIENVLNEFVTLECFEYDKYGRILANVYFGNNQLLNQLLIDNGLAVAYFGGTK